MDIERYKITLNDSESKYLQIYNSIRDMIEEGKIFANEKLPTIRGLSKMLKVNTITVIKAYELLESENYIIKIQGSGSYVKNRAVTKDKIEDFDGIYRLDSGNPPADIFPFEEFKKAVNIALEEEPKSIFYFDEGHGIDELKRIMTDYLKCCNINTKPQNMVIVSGAQQGIDIVSKSMINYSDIVFIEEPTYSGAIDVLKTRGAKLVSIPLLKDGIDIGILKLKLEKIKPKLLYVMPNFQNPTGISYSEYKKKKLIELSEEYDFYIVEDDFISDFKFESENNRTLKSYDIHGRVIYIKSFSKILMPGLRVGIMDIPSELINRIIISKYNSDMSTSTLIQKSLYYYMDRFNWKKHISRVEKIYTIKYSEIKSYLHKKLGDKVKIVENSGGINFFIELKRGYYSRDFVDFMLEKGVALQSGAIYFDNDIDDRFFRINTARESVIRIKEAIDIISSGLDEFYEIYKNNREIKNVNI